MKFDPAVLAAVLMVSSTWLFGLASSSQATQARGKTKQDDDSVQGTWLPATAEGDDLRDGHATEPLRPFLRLNFATAWVRNQERSRRSNAITLT